MRRALWFAAGALGLTAAVVLMAVAQPGAGRRGQRAFGPPGDAGRGRVLAAACAACHGPTGDGADPQYPKLAGQDPAYLRQQLLDFRSGARRSSVMQPLAANLSLADMADLAAYFAVQRSTPDRLADRRLAAEGKRIFYARGPAGPPCAACHAAGGQGMGGMMGGGQVMGGRGMMGGGMTGSGGPSPSLAGQHAAYILAQLDAFEAGARPGPVMGPIAAALTPHDRRAVAAYVAGLR